MVKFENHCCDCATVAYPCLGNRCPNRRIAVCYCDNCDPNHNYPLDEAFEINGIDVCLECLKKEFKKEF